MKQIISLSGGQDSTAMAVRMLEQAEQVDALVFADTGNEFPQMYDYLDQLDSWLRRHYSIGITRIKGKNSLYSLASLPFSAGKVKGKVRGLPYASGMSYCTRDLKVNVIRRWARALSDDVTMCLGYVARETGRVHQPQQKWLANRFPLIEWGWNESEVSQYLKHRSIWNPLYKNFSRTGCMFCPKQTKASWASLYLHHPDQWEEAKRWEKRMHELDAHIKHFRTDGPLEKLEREFFALSRQSVFDLENWNDQSVSCMCR